MTKPGKPDPDQPDEQLMAELEKAPPPPEEPVMPTAREAAARRRPEVTAPTLLRVDFYLFALVAVLGIANGVLLLINRQTMISNSVRDNETDLTSEQITNAVNAAVWILLVAGVVFGALFTLFAYKAREGAKKARTLLAVITVIVVLFNILFLPTAIGQLSALIAIVATGLLFAPSVSRYFRERVIS